MFTLASLLAENAPRWTDKVSAIATAVAAVFAIFAAVGAWFAFDQVKESRRDRHVGVLSEFGRRWDGEQLTTAREKLLSYSSEDLVAAVDEWLTLPIEEEPSDVPMLLRVPNFFEDLAIMVDLGRLELKYVAKSFKASALTEWPYWEPVVTRMRERDPEAYTEWETLVQQLNNPPRRWWEGSKPR